MAVTSRHLEHIIRFKAKLRKRFEISDLGELTWLLGLKVERNRSACTLALSQHAYIDTVLECFHLEDAKPASIPMHVGASLSSEQSPSTHEETCDMQDIPYQRGIGSLMYAATSTRPDIAFAVSILSQFMRNPGRVHWEAVKEVIRYLKGTASVKLTLGGKPEGLEAYVDSDWASQPHRHSMSGYTVLLHGAPVAWASRKQSLIALSTAEAEYIALTAVAREVLYLCSLLTELYEEVTLPIPIYCDNQGAIALASNHKFHARTKHVDLRYHFIRKQVSEGIFDLQYCPTEENIADAFTKALPCPRLEKLRAALKISTARGGVLVSEVSEAL
jgi:hypothetical protein